MVKYQLNNNNPTFRTFEIIITKFVVFITGYMFLYYSNTKTTEAAGGKKWGKNLHSFLMKN